MQRYKMMTNGRNWIVTPHPEGDLVYFSDHAERVRVLEEALADIVHLWVDSYIVKNPSSRADASISADAFKKAEAILAECGITVNYNGWERAALAQSAAGGGE